MNPINRSGRFASALNSPPASIMMLDVLLSLRAVLYAQMFRIPLDFFADAIGHVAEQASLGHHPAIFKMASRFPLGFAGVDPLRVMANGIRYGRRRRDKAGKILFGQQHVLFV